MKIISASGAGGQARSSRNKIIAPGRSSPALGRRQRRLHRAWNLAGRPQAARQHGVVAERGRLRGRPQRTHALERMHDAMHADRGAVHGPAVVAGALDEQLTRLARSAGHQRNDLRQRDAGASARRSFPPPPSSRGRRRSRQRTGVRRFPGRRPQRRRGRLLRAQSEPAGRVAPRSTGARSSARARSVSAFWRSARSPSPRGRNEGSSAPPIWNQRRRRATIMRLMKGPRPTKRRSIRGLSSSARISAGSSASTRSISPGTRMRRAMVSSLRAARGRSCCARHAASLRALERAVAARRA